MRLKMTLKIPSSSKGLVTDRVTRTFSRAIASARSRIVPLVVERAQAIVTKEAPALATRYQKAIAKANAVEVTDKDVTLTISDPIVVAAERGTKAFDMKAKLLAHATKSGKNGPYIDIPFTHKAGSIPASVKAAASKGSKMAGNAAAVRVATSTPGRSFTRSLQRGSIGQALGFKARKQNVQHKVGIHDDMTRKATKTGGRTSMSYTTIRRVSANSSSTSWWHPGFKAAHVLDKVMKGVRGDVAAIIRDAFSTVRSGS